MITSDEYCTVAEAAELLRVSEPTIRRWIDSGRLPASRVGARAIRIRRRDLAAVAEPARVPVSHAELERYTVHLGERNIDQRMLARRLLAEYDEFIRAGGTLLKDSAALIREARADREAQMAEW